MQCMWYELASGESYLRQNDLGRALKKFLAVEKHYADMTEDQFDFHSYCLRKMTLRAYVSMLKFQDRLHSHPYFHKAAAGTIRCYMKLHDSPLKSSNEEEDEMSKLPPSQRKKLRQKQRKAEARNKKEAEEKNEVESTSVTVSKSGKRQVKAVDLDPHGENLLQVEDPLSEATKYLKLLQSNSAKSLETHILSFELNMRKQKILLAFQLSSNCSNWTRITLILIVACQFNGRSLIEANRSFLEIHKGSLMRRVAAAEMMYMLEPDKKHEAIKLVEDSIKEITSTDGIPCPVKEWKLQECVLVHKMLETVFVDNDAASRWKTQCSEYFPYSTDFEGRKSSIITQSANNGMLNAPENGDLASHEAESRSSITLNGKLPAFKDLAI